MTTSLLLPLCVVPYGVRYSVFTCHDRSLADPSCASSGGRPHYATNGNSFPDTGTATTATVKLGRKKLGVFKVDTALPDIFPGETILKVPLPSSVWQAASTARGAKLCIKLQGTCTRLGELLLDGRDREPEDAWEVALLNKSTQW